MLSSFLRSGKKNKKAGTTINPPLMEEIETIITLASEENLSDINSDDDTTLYTIEEEDDVKSIRKNFLLVGSSKFMGVLRRALFTKKGESATLPSDVSLSNATDSEDSSILFPVDDDEEALNWLSSISLSTSTRLDSNLQFSSNIIDNINTIDNIWDDNFGSGSSDIITWLSDSSSNSNPSSSSNNTGNNDKIIITIDDILDDLDECNDTHYVSNSNNSDLSSSGNSKSAAVVTARASEPTVTVLVTAATILRSILLTTAATVISAVATLLLQASNVNNDARKNCRNVVNR